MPATKLVITNDDGIDAPGLAALCEGAGGLGELLVYAPVEALSGCSHRVTTGEPIRLHRRGTRVAVEGTPADCVRVALHECGNEPLAVLSGVNHGSNLGVDVWHSGTVAAVREAVFHGRPAIAVSHYHRPGTPVDWARVAGLLTPILADLLQRDCQAPMFWNVNLPAMKPADPDPEAVFCPLDISPLPLGYRETGDVLQYEGNYADRRRQPGKDVDVCFGGRVAVTAVSLE